MSLAAVVIGLYEHTLKLVLQGSVLLRNILYPLVFFAAPQSVPWIFQTVGRGDWALDTGMG